MIGFWTRVVFAFRCFVSILFRGRIPPDIASRLAATTAPPATTALKGAVTRVEAAAPKPESYDRAVQMLALFQRDGRLIDFLAEDVSPYPDAQLGAAVRTIHQSCRKVLDDYVKLEPVLSGEEDRPVTLQSGIDPAAIKLIGNVVAEPPIKGTLRHRGWRVKDVHLPSLPEGSGRSIVAPAEVEVA